MIISKCFYRSLQYILKRFCSSAAKVTVNRPKKVPKTIENFFKDGELRKLKQYIPPQYLQISTKSLERAYLICPKTAKTIASLLIPQLKLDEIICETNAGLGLIATELMDNGAKFIRFYESCSDFLPELKGYANVYPERVELFTKDIFLIGRYDYLDKQDRSNRVESLLQNIPKRNWIDDPAMTIIGTMLHNNFLKYLVNSLALQNSIGTRGRIQLFVFMRPKDYAVLSAKTHHNLCAYKSWTILFNLIFNHELLEKFPRNIFLPWEKEPTRNCYPLNLDVDKLYLVKICHKKELPVPVHQLMSLVYFIRHAYGKGNNKIIPTIEKWVPNFGLHLILPRLRHSEYFEEINIFTKFRELTPNEILAIYIEMINNPSYVGSSFMEIVENQLLKSETVESGTDGTTYMEKNVVQDMEENPDK